MAETLIKKTSDEGYIIAWKHKQNHTDLGKFDKVMTYGEALKECEKLIEENQEKLFGLKNPRIAKKDSHFHRLYNFLLLDF